MQRSSTQQAHIDAEVQTIWELVGDPNRHPDWWPDVIEVECADLREGCRYRGVVKGFFGVDDHELLIEQLDDCREVSIFCEGTGVTTRFLLTEARGGTFVEGYFAIEPNTIGMKVLGAVAGRRLMRSWLESSLANLKSVAEREPTPT
ncbi:MAG: Polyketide cyclase / dehydrase and lipid transport [Thermoleophilaceae bacterium]|nr:Polyketide cyclase / dehydrase and lipid transport [Thermoleophilaceae bacterium]